LLAHFSLQSNLYPDSLWLTEWGIYGSSRLGVAKSGKLITSVFGRDINEDGLISSSEYNISTLNNINESNSSFSYIRGKKHDEFSNHLGNILVVVNDKKKSICVSGSFVEYKAEVVSAADYSPFGAPLAGRTFQSGEYRFGFGGQERDDEIAGIGNTMTAEFWEYDARLGRRWNVDPVDKPWMSPYHAFSNKPILNVDPNGALDTKYEDEKGNEIANTNDGNNSTVKVDDNKRAEFDKMMSEAKSKNKQDDASTNQHIINQITPANRPLYFTSQSYGLQYMVLAQDENKVEMTGYLETKGGLIVSPRAGYSPYAKKHLKNTEGASYGQLLSLTNGGYVKILGTIYKATAHIHTHPNKEFAEDFSGMPGDGESGDIQSFEGDFFRKNDINTFYLLAPQGIRAGYVTPSDGRVNNLWYLGSRQPYLSGAKKIRSY